MTTLPTAIAFEGDRRICRRLACRCRHGRSASGSAKATHENIHVFDYVSGKDPAPRSERDRRRTSAPATPTRRSAAIVAPEEPAPDAPRGPGRPKLGVVAREVTLLPRHWDWLNAQPGGASVALRKLVEEARKTRGQSDTLRARQEAAYRFLSAIAGDWRNYEEATRALFAGDAVRFAELTESWPTDVRDHARHLASAAFSSRKT